jgi:hypothetical protein
MRFKENLTLRGHQEGDEKSGGGFSIPYIIDKENAVLIFYPIN